MFISLLMFMSSYLYVQRSVCCMWSFEYNNSVTSNKQFYRLLFSSMRIIQRTWFGVVVSVYSSDNRMNNCGKALKAITSRILQKYQKLHRLFIMYSAVQFLPSISLLSSKLQIVYKNYIIIICTSISQTKIGLILLSPSLSL